MTTATDAETKGRPANVLAEHHREMDEHLDSLVARAKEDDPTALRAAWTAFERELLRHMELEEAEILPGFARQDAVGARSILADLAEIRSGLLEMGLNLDLHLVRAEAVELFVRRLKEHARREEAALYTWAVRHVTPGGWHSIKRGLKGASDTGRAPARLGSRII
jgi:hemerythrin-like domain-containing protein